MVQFDTTQIRLLCLDHSPDAYLSLFTKISCSSILSMEHQSFEPTPSETANLRDPEVVKSLETLFDGERFTPEMERACPPLLEIGDDELPFCHSNAESMIDFPKFYFDSSFCSTFEDATPSAEEKAESITAFVIDHRSDHEPLFVDNTPVSITTDLPTSLLYPLLISISISKLN